MPTNATEKCECTENYYTVYREGKNHYELSHARTRSIRGIYENCARDNNIGWKRGARLSTPLIHVPQLYIRYLRDYIRKKSSLIVSSGFIVAHTRIFAGIQRECTEYSGSITAAAAAAAHMSRYTSSPTALCTMRITWSESRRVKKTLACQKSFAWEFITAFFCCVLFFIYFLTLL